MPSMSSPNEHSKARRVALTGLLSALALIFSYVEVLVPFNAGVPGIKLGLANLVPLIIMYRMDARYAFAANLIRVLLAGLLFSGLFAALYSLAGSCASFLVMYLLKKAGLFSDPDDQPEAVSDPLRRVYGCHQPSSGRL